MKALKLKTLFVALASAMTLSSCLGDSEVTDYPHYSTYVTVKGDSFFGYTFYADFGGTLIPTLQSIKEVVPGLVNSDVKRMYISFDLVPESDNGKTLQAGATYNIALKSSYGSNIAIPTYSTVDTYGNQAAIDSLTTKNEPINTISNRIWAANGYLNTSMTIDYDYSKPFYMHTYYNPEEDINFDEKTLHLNLYYNSNSTYTDQQGSSVFSFELPQYAASQFLMNGFSSNDSINLVLRAVTDHTLQLTEITQCKMAIEDFYQPGSIF